MPAVVHRRPVRSQTLLRRFVWTAAPAGGIVTLEAAVAGTGAVTANIVRDPLALAAAPAGVGAVTVAAALSTALQTAVAGTGAVAVAVAVERSLTASVAGVGQALNAVTLNEALNAAVEGTGTVAPELVVAAAPQEPSDHDPNVQFFHTTRG